MAFLKEQSIFFYKMQGSGNDFVLILKDELNENPENMSYWAQCICKRAFAVGADGLIFLESTPEDPETDFKWDFFNSDGSRAEMCGNGSRCAAALAYYLKIAAQEHTLGTDAGPVQSEVFPEQSEVKVQLTQPREMNTHVDLELGDDYSLNIHHVNTGVPHAVIISQNANNEDLGHLGPAIRYHDYFSPQGANLNIVQRIDPGHLYVRTYERGVEEETYACGTGAAASAFIANNLGICEEKVNITTSGGEKLQVELKDGFAYLQGKANLVYRGELNPRAVGL